MRFVQGLRCRPALRKDAPLPQLRLPLQGGRSTLHAHLGPLSEDVVLSSETNLGLPARAAARPNTDYTAAELLAVVIASIEDDKAEEVVQIDLRGRSDVADYMIVCSGRSTRQVAAISEKLTEKLKATFHFTAKMEGKETGDWVLIDAGDVIVHVFRPEVREFYQLEKIWAAGSAHRGA